MLDDGVNVLEVGRPRKALLVDLLEDPLQTFDDLFALARVDDALADQHSRVRETATNVVPQDAVVELERAREPEHRAVEAGREAPGPKRLPALGHFGRLAGAFFGALIAFFGMSSEASLPSPQSACVRAWVRSGRPKTLMNPSDARWSNASPLPYVASDVE